VGSEQQCRNSPGRGDTKRSSRISILRKTPARVHWPLAAPRSLRLLQPAWVCKGDSAAVGKTASSSVCAIISETEPAVCSPPEGAAPANRGGRRAAAVSGCGRTPPFRWAGRGSTFIPPFRGDLLLQFNQLQKNRIVLRSREPECRGSIRDFAASLRSGLRLGSGGSRSYQGDPADGPHALIERAGPNENHRSSAPNRLRPGFKTSSELHSSSRPEVRGRSRNLTGRDRLHLESTRTQLQGQFQRVIGGVGNDPCQAASSPRSGEANLQKKGRLRQLSFANAPRHRAAGCPVQQCCQFTPTLSHRGTSIAQVCKLFATSLSVAIQTLGRTPQGGGQCGNLLPGPIQIARIDRLISHLYTTRRTRCTAGA